MSGFSAHVEAFVLLDDPVDFLEVVHFDVEVLRGSSRLRFLRAVVVLHKQQHVRSDRSVEALLLWSRPHTCHLRRMRQLRDRQLHFLTHLFLSRKGLRLRLFVD